MSKIDRFKKKNPDAFKKFMLDVRESEKDKRIERIHRNEANAQKLLEKLKEIVDEKSNEV